MNTKLFCNLFGICLILLLPSHYAIAQGSEEDGDDDSGDKGASSSASCNSVWSSWSTPSACSDTCGSCGTQIVTRTCTTLSTCPCSGKSSKPVPCGTTPCMYPRVSCCKDYKAMALGRKIICGLISRHRKRHGRKLNKKKKTAGFRKKASRHLSKKLKSIAKTLKSVQKSLSNLMSSSGR